jgi:hypothetical protein
MCFYGSCCLYQEDTDIGFTYLRSSVNSDDFGHIHPHLTMRFAVFRIVRESEGSLHRGGRLHPAKQSPRQLGTGHSIPFFTLVK